VPANVDTGAILVTKANLGSARVQELLNPESSDRGRPSREFWRDRWTWDSRRAAVAIFSRRLLQRGRGRSWTWTSFIGRSSGSHGFDRPPRERPSAGGLDDPARIQDAARAFATIGCVHCHGAPGVKWVRFSEGLHPDPPDLKELAGDRTVAQLFWVIKNGINMTGMPSFFLAGAKDEELWSIAAFRQAASEHFGGRLQRLDGALRRQQIAAGAASRSWPSTITCSMTGRARFSSISGLTTTPSTGKSLRAEPDAVHVAPNG